MAIKPLGQKAYGSIGHLPGSRKGTGDRGVPDGQGAICTSKARDKHDKIIVQEKLDGTNVAVANVGGQIIPLIRAGYSTIDSPQEQHRLFGDWVFERFDWWSFLKPGERLCGEWVAYAHGTRYRLPHDAFIAFDLMVGHERATLEAFNNRVPSQIVHPNLIHVGGPMAVEEALSLLCPTVHGAVDPIEGCVWRVERKGKVDFLAKYVRPEKKDGAYFPQNNGGIETWNWHPFKKVWWQ